MNVREILTDPDYSALKDFVLNHTGLAYYADKDEDFATRLSRRIATLKVATCSSYLDILSQPFQKPSEIDALVGELTIGETYFFRQREHFDQLRSTIIPNLIEKNRQSRQLRIWSAGCATGAEPYSLAMMLKLDFASDLHDWDVFILGTDINVDFLAHARTGSFTNWALRDVPREMKACCFQQDGNRWVLNSEFRKAVTFNYHNLAEGSASPAPDGLPFDLILCRNVMIYFSADRIRSVAERFFDLLADGGWLLVGHAELSADTFYRFELVRESEMTAYRKPHPGEELVYRPSSQWQPLPSEEFDEHSVVPAVPDARAIQPAQHLRDSVEDARMLADGGDWNGASAMCRRLIQSDPLNAPAHFMLAMVLSHTESAEPAASELRRAIYADRKFVLAYYYLGTLLQTRGSLAAAHKAFRNAMSLLDGRSADEPLEHGDGITVEELRELTRMHQEILAE